MTDDGTELESQQKQTLTNNVFDIVYTFHTPNVN